MKFVAHTLALAISHSLVSALLLEVPDGPYLVKWTSQELVDHDRIDPFNSSHARRLMISRFTPVPPRECTEECRVPWLEPKTRADIANIFAPYLDPFHWPRDLWGQFELQVCCKDKSRRHDFPIVLFSPGLNATRLIYSLTGQHLASMGYEVVTMDHPYESNVVWFPDGSVIYGGRITYEWDPDDPDDPLMAWAQSVRVADASFVLDSIGVGPHEKVVAVGHSFGGATSAAIALNDSRVVAAINYDGTMYGSKYGSLTGGVNRPILLLASKAHTFEIDNTWEHFWNATVTNYPGNWIKYLMVTEAAHSTYSDFTAVGDLTNFREDDFLRDNVFGNITGTRFLKILREYSSDFFDFSLRRKGEGLLAGPSPEYPEVAFVKEADMGEL